jgi:hypothetical protein
MTASSETLSGLRDHLTITLTNESDATLDAQAKHYVFSRWRDGGWASIFAKSMTGELAPIEIPPGQDRQWRITHDVTEITSRDTPGPTTTTPFDGGRYQDFLFRFTPGIYGFSFRFSRGDETAVYAREFEVAGEPLPLVPSPRVEETVRQDGTLVVRVRPKVYADNDRRVSLIMDRRSTTPEEAADISLFELYNAGYEMQMREGSDHFVSTHVTRLLRDGLAHYGGDATRIRVETNASVVPPLGLSSEDSPAVVYDGTPWRLTSENGWSSQ